MVLVSVRLSVALTRHLTGGQAPPGDSFQGDLTHIVGLAGGIRPAGRLLGLPESSIRRWLAGATPRRPVDLIRPVRRYFATRESFINAYNGTDSLVVVADTRYSNELRKSRHLHVGREIPLRRIQAILRAWLDGADKTVDNNLMRAIKENYFLLEGGPEDMAMVQIRPERVYFE